ncbi:MAG TPA: hypothetical protein DEB74_07170 [Lachnospiraceae bacterium]|nr:hypothetical protein [Lachnospiraceae bacterium]
MDAKGYEAVRLAGAYAGLKIEDLIIKEEFSKHATVKMKAYIPDDINISDVLLMSREKDIVICLHTGEQKDTLFLGMLQKMELEECLKGKYVSIEAVSYSWILDQEERSKSFQNISMTYEMVTNCLESQGTVYVWNNGGSEKIRNPIIQYNETNWIFIKRLASMQNSVVYVNTKCKAPYICIGLSEAISDTIETIDYQTGIREEYFANGGPMGGLCREDFFCYKVTSYDNFCVGDNVSYKGHSLFVAKKKVTIEQGIIYFRYELVQKAGCFVKRLYNEKIVGSSIIGTVLKTEKETLKLHLDIDEHQETETAYPYQWVPESGNLMYCMPKVGTRVALYIANHDESSAKAVNCMRENGDSCVGMRDSTVKTFTSEHGQIMQFDERNVTFTCNAYGGSQQTFQCMLNDEEGISILSEKQVNIVAVEGILLKAPVISGQCFTELDMLQTGEAVTAVSVANPKASIMSLGNQDYYGSETLLVSHGDNLPEYEPFDDAPEEGEFDWGQLWENVAVGVAVAVVSAAAIAATAVTFGAAAPFMAIFAAGVIGGIVSVACMVCSDWQSGNVSEVGRYAIKGFSGALSGSLAVILGPTASASKYGMWVYAGKAAAAGAEASVAANLVEQLLEAGIYGDDIELSEIAHSLILGYIGGGIAGLISYPQIFKYKKFFNKISGMSEGQVKRFLRHHGTRPKYYAADIEDAFRDAMGRFAESVGKDDVYKAFLKDPLPIYAKKAPEEIKKLLTLAAIRETSIGGAISLIDTILSLGNQSSSDRESAKLIQDYMIQYGY